VRTERLLLAALLAHARIPLDVLVVTRRGRVVGHRGAGEDAAEVGGQQQRDDGREHHHQHRHHERVIIKPLPLAAEIENKSVPVSDDQRHYHIHRRHEENVFHEAAGFHKWAAGLAGEQTAATTTTTTTATTTTTTTTNRTATAMTVFVSSV
jgi:hypothetical protein